ncbi:MAG: redoxin domain-containing protein [Deltaproteobacteria bacterium]|nr:redoxin domain-containing protein [Deltaproteobacteria bacterium]
MLASPLGRTAAAGANEVAGLLSGAGIRPLRPAAAAVDFTLETTDGTRTSLKDQHGSWVVLTFFATWCGPCAMEMPSLAKLAAAMQGKPVKVLAISIDDDPAPVAAYARDRQLTFPVLVDPSHKVAAAYQASSVPVSYIVDPAGALVGISRGARDWSRLVPLFERLSGEEPSAAPPSYAQQDKIEVPAVLTPPTATVAVADAAPVAGRDFAVQVKITWAGNFDEYLLLPPEIHLPAEVLAKGTAATTSSVDGRQVVTYAISVQPQSAGKFALDPIELRYTARGEKEPMTARVPGPTVEVLPWTILGLTPPAFAAVSLLALALVSALGFAWRRRAADPRAPAPSPQAPDVAALGKQLDEARRKRLDGDVAGFLADAVGLARALGDTDLAALEAIAARARYGGGAPSREDLTDLERKLERQVNARVPNSQKEQRDAIRFAKL